MTTSVAFIFLIAATNFFGKGTSRKCFQCVNPPQVACADPLKYGLKPVECNHAFVAYTIAQVNKATGGSNWANPRKGEEKCLKMIVHSTATLAHAGKNDSMFHPVEKHHEHSKHDNIIRGCLHEDRNQYQICEKIQNDAARDKELKYCSSCNDDECNASPEFLRLLFFYFRISSSFSSFIYFT